MLQRFKQNSQPDRIVAIMGPTGSGKSTIIERATGQDDQTIGHGLQSRTAHIRAVRVTHPTDGHPVVFVDTPGFDDTRKSDTEILAMIADWLVKTYTEKVNVAAIVYLHRISDNRMSGSLLKNLQMFSSLCGQEVMPRVVIATTMWGDIRKEVGLRREQELKRDFWKDMLAYGCKTERFENTYESAWRLVGSLAEKDQTQVLLSSEIVDIRLQLNETQAGITLNRVQKHGNRLLARGLNKGAAEMKQTNFQTIDEFRRMVASNEHLLALPR